MGIHNKIITDLMQTARQTEIEWQKAQEEVQRAVSFGDLSENSEYDVAKANFIKLVNKKAEITELLNEPPLYSSNNDIIEPGSIISLKVAGPFKDLDNSSETSNLQKMLFDGSADVNRIENNALSFEGIILYGGRPAIYDFKESKVLGENSTVGKFLLGKPSGSYVIPVTDGFVKVEVQKIKYLRSPDPNMTDTQYSILTFTKEMGGVNLNEGGEPGYKLHMR